MIRRSARAAALVLAIITLAAAPLAALADPAPAPTRFPIRVKGKWGFIDARGKVKVPARYDQVGDFDQGRALVILAGKVGAIDEDGKVLLPLVHRRLGGYADGRHAAVVSDGECGYLDGAGAWSFRLDDCAGLHLDDFSEGLAAVVGPTQTRYFDRDGKLAFTVDGEGEGFVSGVALVKRGGKHLPIDRAGQPLALPAGADQLLGSFWDGMPAPIMIGRTCKRGLCFGTWGYLDPAMKVVIAPQFRMQKPFADGLAAVVIDFDPGWGYIDPTGKVVIPYQFKFAEDFADGLAWVEGHDGRKAVIDRTGAFVIPWRDDVASTGAFRHGLAAIRLASGRYQVIDRRGKQVALLPAGAYPAGWTGDLVGYHTAKNKLVYIDRRGKTVWKER